MAEDALIIRGAREHNLRNIDVTIPRNKLTVITGLSGSGKSSLAFDTIYAEGQRRYVESLSAYARQFLGLMEKPDVDSIEGLSPAISIEQKTAGHNPRSTVGTVTEVYDYLRLLWARAGVPHCPNCGRAVQRQSAAQITDVVLMGTQGAKLEVLAPLVRGRKGEFRELFEAARKQGFVRAWVDGEVIELA
ncbi:MAG TPA: excinuclease ABC subunit UvrA, partial [Gemmatimonadaceae bacterium]|nr:excinuclease ABC subunit UvrA [Gemmatimonadaceae bacterium]